MTNFSFSNNINLFIYHMPLKSKINGIYLNFTYFTLNYTTGIKVSFNFI
jgi:hypothetical protein